MRKITLLILTAILIIGVAYPAMADVTGGSDRERSNTQPNHNGVSANSSIDLENEFILPAPIVNVPPTRVYTTVTPEGDEIELYVYSYSECPDIYQDEYEGDLYVTVDQDDQHDWFPWFITGLVLTLFLLGFLAYLLASGRIAQYNEARRLHDQERADTVNTQKEDHRHAEEMHKIGLEYAGLQIADNGGEFRSVVSGPYRQFHATGASRYERGRLIEKHGYQEAQKTETGDTKPDDPKVSDPVKYDDSGLRSSIADLKKAQGNTDSQIRGIRTDVNNLQGDMRKTRGSIQDLIGQISSKTGTTTSGKATPPTGDDLAKMSIADLKKAAANESVDLSSLGKKPNKQKIITAILDARKK